MSRKMKGACMQPILIIAIQKDYIVLKEEETFYSVILQLDTTITALTAYLPKQDCRMLRTKRTGTLGK
jgi:hypothetical protein